MARIKSGTLTGSAVTTVTLDQPYGSVEVLNRSGAFEIWFNVDAAVAPTVGGDDCHCLPAVMGALEVASGTDENTVVQLLSTGAATYTVAGIG